MKYLIILLIGFPVGWMMHAFWHDQPLTQKETLFLMMMLILAIIFLPWR